MQPPGRVSCYTVRLNNFSLSVHGGRCQQTLLKVKIDYVDRFGFAEYFGDFFERVKEIVGQ